MVVVCSYFYIFVFIFFLMLLCAPRSTLFPYTTLFRSRGDKDAVYCLWDRTLCAGGGFALLPLNPKSRSRAKPPPRSEEHTSELQSHSDLVCRLLLEKKKK